MSLMQQIQHKQQCTVSLTLLVFASYCLWNKNKRGPFGGCKTHPPLIPRTYIFLVLYSIVDLFYWAYTIFNLFSYFRAFRPYFTPFCRVYFGILRNVGLRNKRGCFQHPLSFRLTRQSQNWLSPVRLYKSFYLSSTWKAQ